MATPNISHVQPNRGRWYPAQAMPAKPKGALGRQIDRISDFLLKYWAHLVTIFLGGLVFAALSVPFLSYFGLDAISKQIFYALHYFCAQIPSHSFYIFGHQLGFCARNFSIYTSMFLGSLVFVLSKKRMRGIPWWIWVLMMVPMGWDGITQMFGLRESDWILRVITGTLFGLGNVWFALPLMQKSLETPVPPRYVYQASRAAMLQQVMPAPVVPAPAPVPMQDDAANEEHPQPVAQAKQEKPAALDNSEGAQSQDH